MKERNYGIDLLRLILMYMVCVLHTLGQGGILGASTKGTPGFAAFWLLETLCYCAVDGFAIISGYTAQDRPQRFDKLVNMWFQVFFYSFIVTAILGAAGANGVFSVMEMIKCAFPVTFSRYWYFTAYFAVFFAAPVLNKFVFSVDEQTAKKALIILCVIFSGLGIIADPFKTAWGYSALWLIALYLVGALMKKIRLFEKCRSWILVLLWAFCIIASCFAYVLFGVGRQINYISPTIVLSAIIMVTLFSRMRPDPRVIGKLSPLAFGIYLLQLNTVIWEYVYNAFAQVANLNVALGLLCSLGIAAAIFLSGLIVEFIRAKVSKALKIPALSRSIAAFADRSLTKLFVFLR